MDWETIGTIMAIIAGAFLLILVLVLGVIWGDRVTADYCAKTECIKIERIAKETGLTAREVIEAKILKELIDNMGSSD